MLYTQPRLILYSDEGSPGNQLRHEATRKVQILSWGIKCAAGMSVDQLWFTLGVARSSIVSALKGGMSGYVKKALRFFFEPINMHHGVQLRVRNQVCIKFAKFGMFLADEVALKEVFDFRGASGVLLCPLCLNIVSEGSSLRLYGVSPLTLTVVGDAVGYLCCSCHRIPWSRSSVTNAVDATLVAWSERGASFSTRSRSWYLLDLRLSYGCKLFNRRPAGQDHAAALF